MPAPAPAGAPAAPSRQSPPAGRAAPPARRCSHAPCPSWSSSSSREQGGQGAQRSVERTSVDRANRGAPRVRCCSQMRRRFRGLGAASAAPSSAAKQGQHAALRTRLYTSENPNSRRHSSRSSNRSASPSCPYAPGLLLQGREAGGRREVVGLVGMQAKCGRLYCGRRASVQCSAWRACCGLGRHRVPQA